MILKRISRILIIVALVANMPLNIAFAEETMDIMTDEETKPVNHSFENLKIEDTLATENLDNIVVYNDDTILAVDANEYETDPLQLEKATNVIWSGTISANGIEGITKYLTPTWNSNQTAKVVFIITNGGDTPVLFSIIDGSYGGALGSVTVPTSGTKTLTINGNDIPKTLTQGIYYANITARAVNANYEPDAIKFHITANLITN